MFVFASSAVDDIIDVQPDAGNGLCAPAPRTGALVPVSIV